MPRATLFLPDLSISNVRTLADVSGDYPQLARVLARAELTAFSGPLEYALCSLFTHTAPFAIAHFTACYDLGGAAHELIRCDPVHLHADPNKVLLMGPEHFDLNDAEADGLLARLQREFPAMDWCRGRSPTRWYMRRPPELAADGPPTAWLSGRSLTPFVPTDAAHRDLRRWLNDIQMVLHEDPVNHARTSRGALPINGAWLFGHGRPGAGSVTAVAIGNDVLLAGLAKQQQLPHAFAADPARVACGARDLIIVAGSGFGVADPTCEGVTLKMLDNLWMPALLAALRRGQLDAVDMYIAGHVARVSWRHSWRVWRKPMRLEVQHLR